MEQLIKAVEATKTENISINVLASAVDLMEFGRYLIDAAKEELRNDIKSGEEDLLVRVPEAMERLKIKDRTTLYRWEKRGYLVPVRSGNKCLYRTSDIDRVLTTKDERK